MTNLQVAEECGKQVVVYPQRRKSAGITMRLLLALTLIATNAIANTYESAQAVMDEVRKDNKYVNYADKDFRPMKRYEVGNCARFAATYAEKMNARGVGTYPLTVSMKGVGGHAVAVTDDGWVLDVRSKNPKTIQDFMKE